jgi:glycosyltransferase involved in cell wall biosynthesis
MNNHFPKILILGQTFNDFSGGGVTLSNLFKGWPIDNLAVISYPFMLHNAATTICQNYYQIGQEELTWRFPLSILKQKFQSGKLHHKKESKLSILHETPSFRHSFSSTFVTPFLRWAGLVHVTSRIDISPQLRKWLSDFSPEVLYIQISNRESINFAIELIEHIKIPSVLHMMDDWPSTISSRGLFNKYWHRVIDREFRVLLDKTNLHLSISDAMSEEYLIRYGKHFIPFHNSIESERFNLEFKAQKGEDNKLRILYMGRIGTANRSSLLGFAKGISVCDFPDFSVEFDIYTKDYESLDSKKIRRFKQVSIYKAVENIDIPDLLVSYDILLLPLDFTDSGLKFSRLSMPTKAIEYMASGTPILVYAPSETAIYKFCNRNECAHCIPSPDHQELSRSMVKLFTDPEYRDRLALNARQIARQQFDAVKVRQEFRSTISNLINN